MTESGEVAALRALLQEKEESLTLSANIGKSLLEANNSLSERCEELSEEYSKKIEALEQEKYELSMRLAAKEKMEKVIQDQLENQQSQNRKEAELQLEQVQLKHTRFVQELQGNLKQYKSDLDIAAKMIEQLKETITKQEEMLQSTYKKLQSAEFMTTAADDNEELMSLRHQSNLLKSDKDFLEMELKQSHDELEKLNLVIHSKDQQIHDLEAEKEEEMRQGTSYYNALEKCREEVMELKVELDAVTMDSMDHKKKGNSLFGEVEDRRKELESKLISMNVKVKAANEKLSTYKQQVHRLKFQIAGLLQMSGGMADAAQIERLEQALSQRDGEIEILNSRIARMESGQNAGKDDQLEVFCSKIKDMHGSHHQVGKELIDLLQSKLKDANEKVEKVTKELQNERMLVMAGGDRILRVERELYQSEAEASGLKATNLKLNLKLDELRFKLKIPDPNAPKPGAQGYYIEKIPMPTPKTTEDQLPAVPTSTAANSLTSAATTTSSAAVGQSDQRSNDSSSVQCSSSAVGPQCSTSSDVIGASAPVIPKLQTASKKSVRMWESVSMLGEAGQVTETAQLKTGDEQSSATKRQMVDNPEGTENSEETELATGENSGTLRGVTAAGGRKRPKGRKQIKVIHVKDAEPLGNECKQQ